MTCSVVKVLGDWRDVADACRTTIGKDEGSGEVSESFKHKLLASEHSPIRIINVIAEFEDLPYAISTHFVRHKIGIEHWISTQRDDRTGEDRGLKSQMAPVRYRFMANLQAIITISRKRLCTSADKTTREAWRMFLEELYKVLPEMEQHCTRECEYRGGCTEYKCCGFMKPKE